MANRDEEASFDALLGPWDGIDRDALALGMRISRLGRISEQLYERAAMAFDLNASEAATLTSLLLVGPPHEMLPSRIRAEVVQTSAGVSGVLKRLEGKGLVERRSDAADGRKVYVVLTARGLATIRSFLEHRAGLLSRYLASIEDLAAVNAQVRSLVHAFERAAGYDQWHRPGTS